MTLGHIRRGISEKILLGFVVMALMIGALGGYGIYVLGVAGDIVADTYDRPLMTVNYARAANQTFVEMQEERYRRKTVTGPETAAIDLLMPELAKTFFDDLAVARERALTEDERSRIDAIRGMVVQWDLKWSMADGSPGGRELENLSHRIDDAFDRLIELTTDNAFIERRRVTGAVSRFKYITMGGAALAMLLAGAITFLLARRIVRPLSAAAKIADRIASGELHTVIPAGGKDETGILLQSMHVMQNSIRVMMSREQAQRRSAQTRLVDALESAHAGMVLLDAKGRIVMANTQMAEFFPSAGPLFEEGRDFAATQLGLRRHFQVPEGAPGLDQIGEGAEIRLTDGRWIRVSRSTTREGGAFFFFTDFSDVKEREQRYLEAQLQAEAASRAKSSFLANMSHELRTPLNAIIGFSDMMSRETFGPLNNPHYASYIADILQSGRHLLTIINGVLDLAKTQSGKLQIQRETVDLGEVLAECTSMMRDQCARAGLTLETIGPDRGLLVTGEAAKLRQVFLNLLSNAVKFTEAGGAVTVHTNPTRSGTILIEVCDTGIGMSADQIPVALAPFGQVDTRLARRYEGTGLGLPLAKELVELHGGTLSIESAPGIGTNVRISLPAAASETTLLTEAAA